jgi:hypothetical protein
MFAERARGRGGGIMANTWFARSIVILGRELCIKRGGKEGCMTMCK